MMSLSTLVLLTKFYSNSNISSIHKHILISNTTINLLRCNIYIIIRILSYSSYFNIEQKYGSTFW